jgi:quercetin dioxygenase-like cupin family protein
MITEAEAIRALAEEGFTTVYVWQDKPGAVYADHTHSTSSTHLVLEGEMTLTQGEVARTYRAGERCDVPAGAVHSARMGPKGCKYVTGE